MFQSYVYKARKEISIICMDLLFLLYVNDISNVPFTKDSPLVMYADDLLLFKPISKRSFTFQCDVKLISRWTL